MLAAIEEKPAISAARPACLALWRENPYRPVSLWDMLQTHAVQFVSLLDHLSRLEQELASGKFEAQKFGLVVGAVRHDCDQLQLISSTKQVERIESLMRESSEKQVRIDLETLRSMIYELRTRTEEDLEESVFFKITSEHVRRCFMRSRKDGLTQFAIMTPEEFFGNETINSFQSAGFDIKQACECFLADNSTACVFHLMRTLEIGLCVFAGHFNIPSDHTNWHNIIEGIEKAIRNMGSDPNRAVDWKDQQEFFSQAATHFMFLKEAWRNYTAHARGKYTDKEAEAILVNVHGFMQTLATRLHE